MKAWQSGMIFPLKLGKLRQKHVYLTKHSRKEKAFLQYYPLWGQHECETASMVTSKIERQITDNEKIKGSIYGFLAECKSRNLAWNVPETAQVLQDVLTRFVVEGGDRARGTLAPPQNFHSPQKNFRKKFTIPWTYLNISSLPWQLPHPHSWNSVPPYHYYYCLLAWFLACKAGLWVCL